MIYVYILLGFLFLISSIFFIPINVIINYHEMLNLDIIIMGIKIHLPFHKKNIENKKIISEIKNKSEKKINNILRLSKNILKVGGKSLIKILKNLTVKEFILNIKVVGNDAAHTAIIYGKVSSIIYSLCGVLISNLQPKNYNINVSPNFLGETSDVQFKMHFYGRIFHVVKSLFYFITEYSKIKNK